MDKKGSEADVIFNRASVALAKSQRLIASWLPPKSEDERKNEKTEEELEKEEKEIFAPIPELLGIGAPLPKDINDSTLKRRILTPDDKLLQQLIGKKAAKAHIAAKQQTTKQNPSAPNSGTKAGRPAPKKEESEDEEEGRASAFKSKKRKLGVNASEQLPGHEMELDMENNLGDSGEGLKLFEQPPFSEGKPELKWENPSKDVNPSDEDSRPKSKKKPGSYLDEILAQRSKKKKNKQNKGS